MISLKKVYRDELLQLALILSLLRVNPDSYFENELYNSVDNLELELDNGTSWRSYGSNLLRRHFIHPKSLDSVLLNYERELFADLNSLGRYNRINPVHQQNITAYLLNVDRTTNNNVPNAQEPPAEPSGQPVQPPQENNDIFVEENAVNPPTPNDVGIELTQEVCLIA